MIIKYYIKLKHHLEVMTFNRRVNKILKKFYSRNSITSEITESEHYLEDFRNKLLFFFKTNSKRGKRKRNIRAYCQYT